MNRQTTRLYEFGSFSLDAQRRRLVRDGEVVPLTSKRFELLLVLIRNHGRVLEKDELMTKLWPDTVVEENNLTVNMCALRKTLADGALDQRFIETVPRRGYRFVASVKEVFDEGSETNAIGLRDERVTISADSSTGSAALPAAAADHNLIPTFVGREQELNRLEALLQRAAEGAGRVAFITGEPGIGKTALADQFLRRARNRNRSLIFSCGRCLEQYGPTEAYLPFLDAVGALLFSADSERIASVLRMYAPTWCLQFPAIFGSSESLERLQRETLGATKERMLREMGDALSAVAVGAPLVLILEDLQWADPCSIDLLRHLCQRMDRQRLLVIGTFRPEEVELSNLPLKNYRREMQAHDQCDEIALGLLGQQHIADYLDARFTPNDFPPELADLIQRKTEGHPLFATSLVQFLVNHGDIVRTGERWTLACPLAEMDLKAPENIRNMIRKKIESLSEEDGRALQYASIEGDQFSSAVLAGLLSTNELVLEERLARLDRVYHLINTCGEEELPDGTLATRYRFAHVLYQNLLYEDMVSKRRISLHRHAGELLIRHYQDQAPRIAAQLAMHFERGRDFRRAVEYLIHAGDNATGRYANVEAEEYYTRALGLIDKLPAPDRTERYLGVYHKRGLVNFALSRFDQAAEDLSRMLDQARAMNEPRLQCVALNALAHVFLFAHRLDEMGARANQSLRTAEAAGDEALRIEALAFIARRDVALGNLTQAKPLLDEAIRVARRLNHKPVLVPVLTWRGLLHFFQSEYESAEQVLREALNLSSELRDSFMILFCFYFLGLTRANLGQISKALQTFDEMTEIARRNGESYQLSKIPNSVGWIHRELEDPDGAMVHDKSGVDIGRKHQILEAEINSLINVGCDHIEKSEGEKTVSAFSEAAALLERDEWHRWRFNIRLQTGKCKYLLSQGELDQAEECARHLLALATHYQAHKYVATAHKLLADTAIARSDLANAEVELNAALDALRAYPAPLAAWRIHAALGRLLLQRGDGESAARAFDAAAAVVRMIASNVNDESLQRTFLNSTAVVEILNRSGAASVAAS